MYQNKRNANNFNQQKNIKRNMSNASLYPAFTQEAEDTINDFLQKYPINIPLRIVLR